LVNPFAQKGIHPPATYTRPLATIRTAIVKPCSTRREVHHDDRHHRQRPPRVFFVGLFGLIQFNASNKHEFTAHLCDTCTELRIPSGQLFCIICRVAKARTASHRNHRIIA
jgi:hypothetical protein